MGHLLKEKLRKSGWKLYNTTEFPIACFTDPAYEKDRHFAAAISRQIVGSGKTWVSVYKTGDIQTLRACITNYATGEKEVQELVDLLNEHRENWLNSTNRS